MDEILDWLQAIQDTELTAYYKKWAMIVIIAASVLVLLAYVAIILKKRGSMGWLVGGFVQVGGIVAEHFMIMKVFTMQHLQRVTVYGSTWSEAQRKAEEVATEMMENLFKDLVPIFFLSLVTLAAFIVTIVFIAKYWKRFPKAAAVFALLLLIAKTFVCPGVAFTTSITEKSQLLTFVKYCIGTIFPVLLLAIVALCQKRYVPDGVSVEASADAVTAVTEDTECADAPDPDDDGEE